MAIPVLDEKIPGFGHADNPDNRLMGRNPGLGYGGHSDLP